MNRHRRFVVASLLTASLPALASARSVKGSARIASERRTATGFERIAVAGDFMVELRQGDREGVELNGDDNLLALLDVKVEGKTLRIAAQRDVRLVPTQPIVVRIALVHLAGVELAGAIFLKSPALRTPRLELQIAGAGEAVFAALQTDRFGVNVGGSGSVQAAGRAASLDLNIAGSAACSMPALDADDVSIDIAGSGSATVQAKSKLRIAIAGSGWVRHGGAAVPTLSIVGSGDVRRL